MICLECLYDNYAAVPVCFNCGRPLWTVTRGSIVGGRYQVLSVLGQGGMGVVYKARDQTLDEPVALKVLSPQVAPTEELASRFHAEIKLARRVRHRNVCAIHEYGEEGSLRYIAMEFVEGTNLQERVRDGGPLPAAEAWDVALQILDGLGAVHDMGIIHRDLKSANIMWDTHGVIRLMDFGLATVRRAEDSPATMTLNLSGTPEYMSPEQIRGDSGDFQSDIYAVGVVLFELLTGEVPFRGDSFIATLQKHLIEPPPLDGARAALLPVHVVPVLRKALAKDPQDRYATARGMAKALRVVRGLTGPAVAVEEPRLRDDWMDLVAGMDSEGDDARAEVLRTLVGSLATGDTPEKCGAALTLGRMGAAARDTVPALVDALNDPHPHVVEAVASALKRIAGARRLAPALPIARVDFEPVEPPAVIDLVDMLRNEDAALRRIAVVALGETRSVGSDAVPTLVEILETEDQAVHLEATRLLGKIGAVSAVPSLVVALSHAPDALVRASAAEALGRIGSRAIVAIPALIAALTHAENAVREAAGAALVSIGLPAAPALIEAVSDDDRHLRTKAASLLTEIATAPANPLYAPGAPSLTASQMSPA